MKKEFVRQRPKWMVRLLFAISADVYEVCTTMEQAQAHFRAVREGIKKVRLFELNPKLHLKEFDNMILINSSKGRTYLKFYINNNYKLWL